MSTVPRRIQSAKAKLANLGRYWRPRHVVTVRTYDELWNAGREARDRTLITQRMTRLLATRNPAFPKPRRGDVLVVYMGAPTEIVVPAQKPDYGYLYQNLHDADSFDLSRLGGTYGFPELRSTHE